MKKEEFALRYKIEELKCENSLLELKNESIKFDNFMRVFLYVAIFFFGIIIGMNIFAWMV